MADSLRVESMVMTGSRLVEKASIARFWSKGKWRWVWLISFAHMITYVFIMNGWDFRLPLLSTAAIVIGFTLAYQFLILFYRANKIWLRMPGLMEVIAVILIIAVIIIGGIVIWMSFWGKTSLVLSLVLAGIFMVAMVVVNREVVRYLLVEVYPMVQCGKAKKLGGSIKDSSHYYIGRAGFGSECPGLWRLSR